MNPPETLAEIHPAQLELERLAAALNEGAVIRKDGDVSIYEESGAVMLSGIDVSFPLSRDPDSPDALRRMPDYLLVLEIARGLMVCRDEDAGVPSQTLDLITEAASRGIKL